MKNNVDEKIGSYAHVGRMPRNPKDGWKIMLPLYSDGCPEVYNQVKPITGNKFCKISQKLCCEEDCPLRE